MGSAHEPADAATSMTQAAVGISGRIGSGKTTFAESLSERLGCPHASFGKYVHSVAIEQGLDAGERQVLQTLGEDLIATVGWHDFCNAVLEYAGYQSGSVVIDGVRHVDAIATLRELTAAVPWYLVAIDVDEAEIGRRRTSRGDDLASIARSESHRNEAQVGDVRALADIIVPAGVAIEEALTMVLGRIHQS